MSAGNNVIKIKPKDNVNLLQLDIHALTKQQTKRKSSCNAVRTSVCSACCVHSLEPAGERNHWASAAFA